MSTPDHVPDLVGKALHNSWVTGWMDTTRNETGRLLAALAASRDGVVAEAGTGSGAGVAWLRTGAPRTTHVVCVEQDAHRADRARAAFEGADVEVLDGSWDALRERAPFSLLYMNRATAQQVGRDLSWSLVEPGGLVVVDDFSPSTDWPPREVDGSVDHLRQQWLADERFCSSEVSVASDVSVVLATRR